MEQNHKCNSKCMRITGGKMHFFTTPNGEEHHVYLDAQKEITKIHRKKDGKTVFEKHIFQGKMVERVLPTEDGGTITYDRNKDGIVTSIITKDANHIIIGKQEMDDNGNLCDVALPKKREPARIA